MIKIERLVPRNFQSRREAVPDIGLPDMLLQTRLLTGNVMRCY